MYRHVCLIIAFCCAFSFSADDAYTIISPLEGDRFVIGDTVLVKWNCISSINNAILEISPDSGKNWIGITNGNTIKTVYPTWKNFPWVVVDSISTASPGKLFSLTGKACCIRIYDYDNRYEAQSGYFLIKPLQNRVLFRPSNSVAIQGTGLKINCSDLRGRTMTHRVQSQEGTGIHTTKNSFLASGVYLRYTERGGGGTAFFMNPLF